MSMKFGPGMHIGMHLVCFSKTRCHRLRPSPLMLLLLLVLLCRGAPEVGMPGFDTFHRPGAHDICCDHIHAVVMRTELVRRAE
jgi:hypothetical protein